MTDSLQVWLEAFLSDHEGVAGTVHVRPGAKAVNAGAGVALPVHDNASGDVRAVVGIAYRDEREITESQLAALSAAAATLP